MQHIALLDLMDRQAVCGQWASPGLHDTRWGRKLAQTLDLVVGFGIATRCCGSGSSVS